MEIISTSTGLWNIYRKVRDDGMAMIYRVPKGGSIETFIRNHQLLKQLGVNTLEFVRKELYDDQLVIVTEDVNHGKPRLYVSANSIYREINRMVDALKDKQLNMTPVDKVMSPYETYRLNNKLGEILNFEQFVSDIKNMLTGLSQHRVIIKYDAYFFGTERKSVSNLDYKFVDLDDITQDEVDTGFYDINYAQFQDAIYSFIQNFVVDDRQDEYLAMI